MFSLCRLRLISLGLLFLAVSPCAVAKNGQKSAAECITRRFSGALVETEIVVVDRRSKEGGFQEAVDTIRDLNQGLLSRMALPKRIYVDRAIAMVSETSLNPGKMKIYLADPDRSENLMAKVAHEYAHAVFMVSMGRYSKRWKKWYELIEEQLDFRLKRIDAIPYERDFERRKALEELARKYPLFLTDFEEESVSSNLTQKKLNKLYKKLVPPGYEFSLRYQELFADLVPVMHSHDPRSLARALIEEGQDPFGRDFTVKTSPDDVRTGKPHHYYDAVRSYLWENYLSKKENEAGYPAMIETVFGVLARDMDEQLKIRKDVQDGKPKWVAKDNERLISSLKDALRDYEK
jgi:hypothetical protein